MLVEKGMGDAGQRGEISGVMFLNRREETRFMHSWRGGLKGTILVQ